jgi:large subunit ribosomal protein L25
MSTGFELSAQIRSSTGKAEARRMRRNGMVPGIIYGTGKEPEMITLPHDKILHALEQEAFYSHVLDIKLDNGKSESVVLKDVQRHVFKPKVEHVDFLRVSASEKLTMHIPLHYLGEEEAAGVKDGGVVSKVMTDIEVKCLPKDLPEFIAVDITNLGLDEALHISDIKLPKGVELLHEIDEDHDQPIISIHEPKVSKEDIAAEAAEEAAAEEASAEAHEGDAVDAEADDAKVDDDADKGED